MEIIRVIIAIIVALVIIFIAITLIKGVPYDLQHGLTNFLNIFGVGVK